MENILTEEIKVCLKGCPTKEEVIYHLIKAEDVFPNIVSRIDEFMLSNEETMCFMEDEFDDVWVFALIMGMCGKRYYQTNTTITYGRSDGHITASIGIINNIVRYNRLMAELEKVENKMRDMDVTTSKYEKLNEKREKLCNEITKYKPI